MEDTERVAAATVTVVVLEQADSVVLWADAAVCIRADSVDL
jgi:hypothetical protein